MTDWYQESELENTSPDRDVYTVSEATRQIKELVEANFPSLWIEGEISGCTRAQSGHVYLTLKDEGAQIRGVLWRRSAEKLKFDIQDGMQVVVAGAVEVYQPRGTYQLIIRDMMPQGMGALELAFRQLQSKLAAEGLFEPERKQPIPRFPLHIAVVTSPTSAAVNDMLQVMTRRWPVGKVTIVPVRVQGEGSAEEIAHGLKMTESLPDVDVVIVGRGGGSLEDLWAFNEEVVARAIAACPHPVVSAVGHEIDVTIADLVADKRALTPSEAGELVVPDFLDLKNSIQLLEQKLRSELKEQARRARLQLEALASRPVFTKPLSQVHDRMTRLDELSEQLRKAIERRMTQSREKLQRVSSTLEALSPLNVLHRGYSVTRDPQTKELITNIDKLSIGDQLETLTEQGSILSRVEETRSTDLFSDNRSSHNK